MKHLLATFAVLGLSGRALAQNCVATALAVIPGCAQNCILEGAPTIGCDGLDFPCQCAKSAALMAAVEPCVAAACPPVSYQAVINGASTVCDCAGSAAPTASMVSGVSGMVPASIPAMATGTVMPGTVVVPTITQTPSKSAASAPTSSFVTAAAARQTGSSNLMRYALPAAMVGAAML